MGMRVKDVGESEGRSVMGRIGLKGDLTSSRPKGSRLPTGLWLQESLENLLGRTRQMTAMASVMTGAASGFEVNWHGIDWTKTHRQVRRLRMRIAKVVHD